MSFEELSHTADVKIRARASTRMPCSGRRAGR